MPPAIRQEFVNPFLDGAQRVWRQELGGPLAFVGAELREDHATTEDITAFVGITGRLEGNVFYGFERYVARTVAGIMLGKRPAGVRERSLSTLGDFAAKITELAADHLVAVGFHVVVTPPTMIRPRGTRFTTLGIPQIMVRLESEFGPLSIRISLREAVARAA